jgi:magnesium chelatase family protein
MSLAIAHTRAQLGIHAPEVFVEVHLANGLPKFLIVGLPETAVKESRDRVQSAIVNSQFKFPARRITVNLAPADLPKEGGRYDLPIALGVLAACKFIPIESLAEYECVGELALSGELRPVKGILPFAIAAQKAGRKLIVPAANANEAGLIDNLTIFPATHLLDVCHHLAGQTLLPVFIGNKPVEKMTHENDLADIIGQPQGRRVLEIAAAGGHSLLMSGSPGTGKTMLASRLPTILPLMTETEALEVAALASIAHKNFHAPAWSMNYQTRPFRSPHHTASSAALVGGGNPPRPGEISLAHQGVLFLDELPEFKRHVLEALREPLESGTITISRAAQQLEFPARFQLIAAMNPCPCGYLGDPKTECHCTPDKIIRYQQRLSGPFLDRIDLHLEINRIPQNLLIKKQVEQGESSATVRARVTTARAKQIARSGKANAHLSTKELLSVVQLTAAQESWLEQAIETLNLSARSYHRLLRVARTIADLAGNEIITMAHLAEALSYRNRKAAVS